METMTAGSAERTRGRAAAVVLMVLVAGAAAYFFLPGFRTSVRQQIDRVGGWNEEARREDPVGFIDFSIRKLSDGIATFESARGQIAMQRAKLADLTKTNQAKLDFSVKQLDAFRAAYKDATGGKGWPAGVAGKSYSEADLKQQVSLLLTQKSSFEETAKGAGQALDKTTQSEGELVNRITTSKAKLDLLKAQRELVKVARLNAETEKLLDDVHDVLVANDALNTESPIRTVDELMKDATRESGATHANVDAFLNQ